MNKEIMNILDVQILNKVYQIRCPEGKAQFLQEATQYVNEKMTKMRDLGKVMSLERLAIITAINISYTLLMLKKELIDLQQEKDQTSSSITKRLYDLQIKIEDILTHQEEIEL